MPRGRAGVCPCPSPCQEVTLDVADVTLCALIPKDQAPIHTKTRPQGCGSAPALDQSLTKQFTLSGQELPGPSPPSCCTHTAWTLPPALHRANKTHLHLNSAAPRASELITGSPGAATGAENGQDTPLAATGIWALTLPVSSSALPKYLLALKQSKKRPNGWSISAGLSAPRFIPSLGSQSLAAH